MELLVDKISKLRLERNAVILAHNYQIGEVQDIADYVGDSLGLSIQAANTKANVIVFCGVYFMAETAKILSPQKTVLMPDISAGCPMADMINVDKLKEIKSKNPNAKVVCYVNSGADIKAESDICCTSANAVKIVQSLPDQEIIFVPDKYLGNFVSTKVPDKKFILYDGYCPSHMRISPEDITKAKIEQPNAYVMVHPECRPEVIALADEALSTGQMLKKAGDPALNAFIIGTEIGIIHTLKKQYPSKQFYPATGKCLCPNMKLTTLEKVLFSLEDMQYEVSVPAGTIEKARGSIDKMLKVV
ncbi:MAG: quinolinate synthase NadA [Candidatus Margulisbacteria bacterium]|nr:quinolinate synthase NadA [Candidatus Margulisiibacteriota bacterium]